MVSELGRFQGITKQWLIYSLLKKYDVLVGVFKKSFLGAFPAVIQAFKFIASSSFMQKIR